MQVNFPQFIDRGRLIFIIEIDMLLVFGGGTMSVLWMLSRVLSQLLAVPLAFYIGWKIMTWYNIAKYEKSPGFVRHFFYHTGIYKPKKDFRKYPELLTRDNEDFYPSGYIRDFRD